MTAGAATGIDVDSSLLRTLRTCLELTAMGTLVETSKGAGKKKKKKNQSRTGWTEKQSTKKIWGVYVICNLYGS